MSVLSVEQLAGQVPLLADLEPPRSTLVAGCALDSHASRPASLLAREGAPADTFFAVREGRVALELVAPAACHRDRDARPGRGLRLVVAVRAVPLAVRRRARSSPSASLAFDAACLRGQDRARRRARLRADAPLRRRHARRACKPTASATRRCLPQPGRLSSARGTMVPRAYRVVRRRRDTADTWTLDARAASRRADLASAPGQFTMLYAVRRRRGADLDQRRPDATRPARAHGPRRRSRDARDLRRARPAQRARRARAVRHGLAGRARRRAPTSSWSPAASASRRCARCSTTRSRTARRFGARRRCSTAARTPGDLLYPARARALAAAAASTSPCTVDAGRRRAGRGHVGVVTTLIGGAEFDPARPSRWSAGPRS